MINRIYRITVVGDSSWRVERPVSHPDPNSLNSVNSVNTVSKTKERICAELESSMGPAPMSVKLWQFTVAVYPDPVGSRLTMNGAEFDYCKFRASFAANQTAQDLTFTNLALDMWWESMI